MIKVILKILLALLIIIIVLFSIMVTAISFFDANKYKDTIEKVFNRQTGQTLILKGPIQIKIFPFPKVQLENSAVRYHLKEHYFILTAEKIAFSTDWSLLFSSEISIQDIRAKKLAIQYVENEHSQQTFLIDDFQGQFNSNCCDMLLTDFKLSSGTQNIEGNIKITFFPGMPKLTGNVTLPELSLVKEAFVKNQVVPFSIFNWLSGIEGNIDVNIKKLNMDQLKLKDAILGFNVKDNKLLISPKGKMAGTVLKGQISLAPLNGLAKLAAEFYIRDGDAKILLADHLEEGLIQTGKLSVNYKAQSEGNDLSTLITRLKSTLMIHLYEVKIPRYQGNVSGDLQIETAEKSTISGTLFSPDWIVPLFSLDPKTKPEKLISERHWTFDKLAGLRGKLLLNFSRLHFENIEIDNAAIELNLTPESFAVTSQGDLTSGKYAANFTVAPGEKNASKIQGKISIHNANATEFIKQFNPKLSIQNGRLQLDFAGNGYGGSLAELMSNLSGKGLITMNDLEIPDYQIDSRYVDFFSATLKALIPRSRKGTKLECFAMKFDVIDGVLSSKDKIGMQTRDLYALGGGELSFKTEKINFQINLYPRSKVNIEVGSYNNVIRVKGSFSDPEVVTSMSGLVKEGGTIALGVATGGLSLLAEKLFKLTTQNKSPCQQVLGSPR